MLKDVPILIRNMEGSIKDLKKILADAEKSRDYDTAKETTKKLFCCYTVLQKLLETRDLCYEELRDRITINLSEATYFDRNYDEVEKELITG